MKQQEEQREAEREQRESGIDIPIIDKRRFANAEAEPAAQAAAENADESGNEACIAELQARLRQSEETIEKMQANFKQAQARLERETAETRARLKRSAEERLEASKGEIYQRLLEVADNLARAISSAAAGADAGTLLEGVKATYTLLLRQLESEGVTQIVAEGEIFDPSLHEAVDTIVVEPAQEGRIIQVYKPGYRFGARLLRPATVQVGKSE